MKTDSYVGNNLSKLYKLIGKLEKRMDRYIVKISQLQVVVREHDEFLDKIKKGLE